MSGYQTNSDIDLPRPCDLEVTDCDLVLQLSTGCMMLAMARRQPHNQAFSVLFKEQSFLDQQIPRYKLQKGLLHFIKQYTSHRCHLPLEIFKWIFISYDKSLLLTKIKVLKRYYQKASSFETLFFTQEVEKEFKRRLCSRHNFCIGYGLVYFLPERQTNDKRYYLYILLRWLEPSVGSALTDLTLD